jgi:lambda repressor-like predicted transcriptional regulator
VDNFDRVRALRDDYESALDEAEKHRADYHREIVKLHRSGVSLREIAEQLGISHQRVHQIVGVAEERGPSRRLIGGVAGAIVVLLAAGIWVSLHRGGGGEAPVAAPIPAHAPPSLDHLRRIDGHLIKTCSVHFVGSKSSFTPMAMAAAASDCSAGTTIAIDPETGKVLAIVRMSRHGRLLGLTYPALGAALAS